MIRMAFFLVVLAGAANAQSVGPSGWQASALALVEPWEDTTALFANGAVRLAAIDTVDPASAAAYLLVLSPPLGELGEQQCRIVWFTDQFGFAAIYFDAVKSDDDPEVGLNFALPVRNIDAPTSFSNSAILLLELNQATGEMTAELALGNE